MKKGLKIAGIILAVIIVIMISIPLFFKGKIKDIVLNAAQEQLNATVAIEDFDLSLFANFPKATIQLKGTSIIGNEPFAGDTLLSAKEASVTVDIMSLFGDNFEISKIILDQARINAIVAEDGTANWNIMKEDAGEAASSDAEDSSFKLDLQGLSLKQARVVYDDRKGGMKAVLNDGNGNLSGDFSAGETTLNIDASISEISFYMGGVPYLHKIKGQANGQLKADLNNMKFTFIESLVKLNDLSAGIDGSFGFVGEEGMEFDLKLLAPDTEFKNILSIVPAMYTDEFKNLKTSGTASLNAYVKGVMEGETYPAFNLAMKVGNAMFQYPDLPQAVNNINMDLLVTNPGGSLDNTVIDLSKFSFNMGGNPFAGALKVTTPSSDATLKAHATGTIDLKMIKDVYPLKAETKLDGIIKADLDIATRMSAIEKEQYEQVQAKGLLTLNGMKYTDQEMNVLINKAELEFTPRYVNLGAFTMTIGKNDISASGRLENFIAYAMKGQTLKGNLNISSNYLNANDFISEETSGVEASKEAPANAEDIIIPKNLDFNLNTNLKKIVYGKMDITNVVGAMTMRDGMLRLNNVSANLLQGTAKITGAYDSSNPKQPKLNLALNLATVSFAETFKQVESIQKFAPIFENIQGNYSMNFDFKTLMSQNTEEMLKTLTGTGKISTSNLKIENVKALDALALALKVDGLKSIAPKDLNIDFAVNDGRIATKPFALNIGKGGVIQLEGSTGLDQSIDYKGNVTLPEGLSNKFINKVPITITGQFNKPSIGVDAKSLISGAAESLKNKLLGGSKGEGEESTTESIGEKVSEKKLETAKKLREEATKESAKLVEAAQTQANALLEKAGSNPLAKMAAKKAGEALVKEAEKASRKIVDKADETAKKLEAEHAAESDE